MDLESDGRMMEKFSVIDLFAGAGGLSHGFMQTQKYDIKVAFENNPNMQETYRKNHPGVDVRGDVCAANYSEIQKQYGTIDVVIGGPPCQGFSNANRQKSTAISKNNMLVKQYIRAILELQPKAFVMENVSMLRSEVHRFYLDAKDAPLISQYHIPTKETRLPLIDSSLMFEGIEVYCHDATLVDRDVLEEDQYAKLNVIYKTAKNLKKLPSALAKHEKLLRKYAGTCTEGPVFNPVQQATTDAFSTVLAYYNGQISINEIQQKIEPAIMYQRMLSKIKEIWDNDLVVDRWETADGLDAIIRSYAVFDYVKAILGSKPNSYAISAGVLCAADFGAPQKRMRFVVMGIKKGICPEVKMPHGSFVPTNYRTVRDAIADLEEVPAVIDLADDVGTALPRIDEISELGSKLRDTNTLFNHITTKTTDIAMERFKVIKQGQNFHSLDDSMKINTYTDVTRTQNTIYLRLNYDEPSGTVINVRKSMWIHPVLNRAISVREAARLQTFPDSYVFCGSKDKQYQQVGNAVPPMMAKAIAKKLAQQLRKSLEETE